MYRAADTLPHLKTYVGLIFLGCFVTVIHATVRLQGLHADGVHHLLEVIQRKGFYLMQPSRLTVQFLQQLPTVTAIQLGLDNLHAISVIYCFTLQVLPLVLVAACYVVLPTNRKKLYRVPITTLPRWDSECLIFPDHGRAGRRCLFLGVILSSSIQVGPETLDAITSGRINIRHLFA